MNQEQINFKTFHGGKFGEAMKQAEQLKNIKNHSVKHWQESNIIKTLLDGLRGK